MLEFTTLETTKLNLIVDAFNESFSDYFFPLKFTEEKLTEKFVSEGIDLKLSVGVFDEQKLVAFILHFSKESQKIIYNGGTGVVPKYRGKGLTAKMYEFISPQLKERDFDSLVLEVLTQNLQAIRVYQKIGFNVKRNVLCFKGNLHISSNLQEVNKEIKIIQDYHWDLFQSFWDFEPTWQNSKETLDKSKAQNICAGVFDKETLLGYIIFNPDTKKIMQVAVRPNCRKEGVGKMLLQYAFGHQAQEIFFMNIDEASKEMIAFLRNCGLKPFTKQYEMIYKIK